MFVRHHNEESRLDSLIEPPARRNGFAAPIVISIAILVAVVTLGTNTQFIAPPLLALLLTAAVAVVLVSLRRPAGDAASPGLRTSLGAAEPDSADAGVVGESLFVASPIPSLLVDGEFHEIMAANPAAAALYGYALADLRGQRVAKLQYSPSTEGEAGSAPPLSGLARHRRVDGSSLWVELGVRQIEHAGRDAWLLVVVDVTARMQLLRELEASEGHCRELIDIGERSRNERRLFESSSKDPLTGCYNRRHLPVFQADAEADARWACIVIDIDYLKRYNDSHGHRAGDQAIVRLARFLDRIVRKDDAIVRLGGDEFAILLRHCDQATLESFATRLHGALATQETIPFSFGLAIRKNSEDLEQTIHRADRQMIERRFIERNSIRLDVPREPRRQELRRPVIRIHPERGNVDPVPVQPIARELEG